MDNQIAKEILIQLTRIADAMEVQNRRTVVAEKKQARREARAVREHRGRNPKQQ